MPYIKNILRVAIAEGSPPQTAGELNYCITKMLLEYMGDKYDYQRINDVIGALEACKMEFNRRIVVPYELTKIESNGDVFPCSTKT
jgi:hypothetical protein